MVIAEGKNCLPAPPPPFSTWQYVTKQNEFCDLTLPRVFLSPQTEAHEVECVWNGQAQNMTIILVILHYYGLFLAALT